MHWFAAENSCVKCKQVGAKAPQVADGRHTSKAVDREAVFRRTAAQMRSSCAEVKPRARRRSGAASRSIASSNEKSRLPERDVQS